MSDEMDDLSFMRDPNRWPNWPVLPMKRWVEDRFAQQLGVMIHDHHGLKPVVLLIDQYELAAMAKESRWDILDVPKCSYDTFEALIADGWKVD